MLFKLQTIPHICFEKIPYLYGSPQPDTTLAEVELSMLARYKTHPSYAAGLKTVETNDSAWHGTNTSYLLNCWCVRTNPSSRIGNFTSQLPTMFWILKSRNLAGKPSFCTTRAYFLAANLDCSSLERRKVNEKQITEKAEENWEKPRRWGKTQESWEHFI